MKMTKLLGSLGIGLVMALAACGGSQAPAGKQYDVGVGDKEIKLGATVPLSGPASAYGTISKASAAYFDYINKEKHGINGRLITYVTYDDAYNPAQTVQLTRQLVEQDKVFATFGALGTQAQTSVVQYMNTKKVPQLGVATGATTWGKDFNQHKWTMSWQPAYQPEAATYAKYLLKANPNPKIGVLYQNDDYGQDYLAGLEGGLGAQKSLIIDKEPYESTAADVTSQVVKLKGSGADTFFIFGTPTFSIKALVTANKLGWKPQTYLNSVSNPLPFMLAVNKAAGTPEATNGVVSVQYIKDPNDPTYDADAGVKLYKQIMQTYYPNGNPADGFNIYGMASAFTMVDVLTKAGDNLTRKNVMDIFSSQLNETNNPFLLPGVIVKTTSNDHFPITQEKLSKFDGKAWNNFGDLIDTRGTVK